MKVFHLVSITELGLFEMKKLLVQFYLEWYEKFFFSNYELEKIVFAMVCKEAQQHRHSLPPLCPQNPSSRL
jgi:hypothetical protein